MGASQAGDRLTARLASLRESLDEALIRDRRRLGSWLARLSRRAGPIDPRELARLEQQLEASVGRAQARRASVPVIRYDETLPVHAKRAAIAAAIRDSPVTIVSGATGSGKSTQLPKICLELGSRLRRSRTGSARSSAQRPATSSATRFGSWIAPVRVPSSS